MTGYHRNVIGRRKHGKDEKAFFGTFRISCGRDELLDLLYDEEIRVSGQVSRLAAGSPTSLAREGDHTSLNPKNIPNVAASRKTADRMLGVA